MASINGIENINQTNHFSEIANDLGSEYDFNNDGKVDISDFQLAKLYLNDDDPTNDIEISNEELNKVFANIIDKDDTETTEDLTNKANTLLDKFNKGLDDPENATSLIDLQCIGIKLTKYIKNCSNLATLMGNQITKVKEELDEIQKEKEIKEEEYNHKTQETEEKSQQLSNKIENTINYADNITKKQSAKCDDIVRQSINEYKEGKYPNQSLQTIILSKLASNTNNSEIENLQSMISENKGIGEEINSLCNEISNLVSDIKDVTERYNNKTSEYNNVVNSRTDILKAAQSASVNYQKGYQKRSELRDALVAKYSAAGGGLEDSNPQIQSLARFLQSGELNNMTFADAWNILSRTFTGIPGLSFNSNFTMDVPKGHSSMQTAIFDQLISSLYNSPSKTGAVLSALSEEGTAAVGDVDGESSRYTEEQYGGYEDEDSPECPGGVERNDPISFTQGDIKYDFIIDRNNDGIFNDQSEFLGAKNGWAEMKSYDTNNDGHISGAELNSLQVLGVNQENGKFTYSNAKEAGINDIDLNSYKRLGQKQINNDIKEGTFKLTTNDGSVITGEQTNDAVQNLNNKYSFVYGSSINETNDSYTNNPFMQEFKETLNIKATKEDTKSDIDASESDANNRIKQGEIRDNRVVSNGIFEGNIKKHNNDKEVEKQQQEDQKKKFDVK